MHDVFPRIGLAIQHLVYQSSINGPQKDEALRLAEELQSCDENLNEIVNARVAAALEGIEARILGYLELTVTELAGALKAKKIDFTPPAAPAPVFVANVEPVEPAAQPHSITGNDPATPIEVDSPVPQEGAPLAPDPEPETIAPATADTETAPVGDETMAGGNGDNSLTASTGDNSLAGGGGDNSIQAGSGNDAIEAEEPKKAAKGAAETATGPSDTKVIVGGDAKDAVK